MIRSLKKVAQEIRYLEEELRGLKDGLSKYQDADATRGDQYTYGIQVLEHRLENAEPPIGKSDGYIGIKSQE